MDNEAEEYYKIRSNNLNSFERNDPLLSNSKRHPMNIGFSSQISGMQNMNRLKANIQIQTSSSSPFNKNESDLRSAPLNRPRGFSNVESEFGSTINVSNPPPELFRRDNHRTSVYQTSPNPHKMVYESSKVHRMPPQNYYDTNENASVAKGLSKASSLENLQKAYKVKKEPSNLNPAKKDNKLPMRMVDWSEINIKKWLIENGLEKYSDLFSENDINGEVIFELNNSLLKDMGIKTVGERVKILHSIKMLKYDALNKFKDVALNQDNMRLSTHSIAEMSNRLNRNKKPGPDLTLKTQRSAGNLRLLDSPNGLPSSKLSTPSNPSPLSGQYSQFTSPLHLQLHSSNYSPSPSLLVPTPPPIDPEINIMKFEKVQRFCVRVVGDGGQSRVIDLKNALSDSKSIMQRVLAKFSLTGPPEDYAIFVNSGDTTKMLNDDELMMICNSPSHPDKDKFILRKKYSPKSHHELQQERLKRLAEQESNPEQQFLAGVEVSNLGKSKGNPNRHSKLFAHRPPSQQITSNLAQYFPAQKLTGHINRGSPLVKLDGSKADKPLKSSRSTKRNNIHKLGIDVLPNLANLSPIHENFSDSDIDPNNMLDATSQISSPVASQPSIATVLSNENLPQTPLSSSISELPKSQSSLIVSSSSDLEINTNVTTTSNNPLLEEKHVSLTDTEEEETKQLPDENDPVSVEAELGAPDKTSETCISTNNARVSMDMEGWIQGALIGAGSFGSVFLGLNPATKFVMAVKQVELPTTTSRTENRQKADQISSLQAEIALMRQLCHPNIVQYLGSSSTETHLNIFLEYVPGGSVAARLAEKGKFTEERTRYYVSQILNGLEYLHSHNIIHRDIKGGNILIDDKDTVKIADFGVSKKVQDSVLSVITPQRVSLQGSVYWMAPEVVKQTHYTRKADIWSLGCLVIEMLSGDHPFPNFTQMQAIFKIGSYSTPDLPKDISELATSFLTSTLQPQHQNRPSSKELISHPFVTDVTPPPLTPRLDKSEIAQFDFELDNETILDSYIN